MVAFSRKVALAWIKKPLFGKEGTGLCLTTIFYESCLKMFRCRASEIPRNESYITVRRNDEG